MQSLTVRETRKLVTRNVGRAVGEQIASAVRKIVAKAKKRTGLVEMLCGKSCHTATFSAASYRTMQEGFRKYGLWSQVREHLARERFEELFSRELQHQARAEVRAHPAQLSFPDFDRLPQIRIDTQTEFCA